MAGEVQGLNSYPPLHAVCARKDPGAAKVSPHKLYMCIKYL